MKFFYWIALIFGGSLVAWFLWKKVEPQKPTKTQAAKPDFTSNPTATKADEAGNVLAFNYKTAPDAGLLN